MEDKEIKAMSDIAAALSGFGDAEAPTVKRILDWALSRYNLVPTERVDRLTPRGVQPGGSRTEALKCESAAELFDAVAPNMEYEKAITIGYWFQVLQGQPEFGSQEVNTALKNMGHGIANITDAFGSAMGRKPSLVLQTQKSGTAKQARKQFKLTLAGIRWVEARLANLDGARDAFAENGGE